MHERFQALVHGAILALIVGWVLYIGKAIFVPVVLSVLVVYVVVGLTRLLERIPGLGPALPVWLRYTLSIVAIALGLVAAFYEIVTYADILRAQAPQYLESLLAAIQRGAPHSSASRASRPGLRSGASSCRRWACSALWDPRWPR
jgi:AI-2 transport protein TqsA